MSKPTDVPQGVWDAVKDVAGVGGGHEMKGYMLSVRERAARLVMAERANAGEAIAVLADILSALRQEAPGTPLNNHKYDQLGIRAYAALTGTSPQPKPPCPRCRDAGCPDCQGAA